VELLCGSVSRTQTGNAPSTHKIIYENNTHKLLIYSCEKQPTEYYNNVSIVLKTLSMARYFS
jgi:hypothetical protein